MMANTANSFCLGLNLPGGSDDPDPGEGRGEAETAVPETQSSPESGMETKSKLCHAHFC